MCVCGSNLARKNEDTEHVTTVQTDHGPIYRSMDWHEERVPFHGRSAELSVEVLRSDHAYYLSVSAQTQHSFKFKPRTSHHTCRRPQRRWTWKHPTVFRQRRREGHRQPLHQHCNFHWCATLLKELCRNDGVVVGFPERIQNWAAENISVQSTPDQSKKQKLLRTWPENQKNSVMIFSQIPWSSFDSISALEKRQ